MASFYTVVQFVPDPITDERVNIGVIAFSGSDVHSVFLSDWRRVRGFGGQDVQFLRDFAAEVSRAGGAQLALGGDLQPRLNEEHLKSMAGQWVNTIQFTPPRASLKPPEVVATELASRFLHSVERKRRSARTRRYAISFSYEVIADALLTKVGLRADQLMQRSLSLQGQINKHEFDVGVANGKPLLALDALAFEGTDERRLQTEVDAVAWAIDDVRKLDKKMPIGVVLLQPRHKSVTYDRARRTFSKLHADALTEKSLPAWSARHAREIASRDHA